MSSSYGSPAPAPPARIRVVSHPPLHPLRAWLPLAGKRTVGDLERVVSQMLGSVEGLEMELQGFALLRESPVDMLDPANDILDVKLSTSTSPALPPPVPALPPAPAAAAPTPASEPNGLPVKRPPPSSSSESSDSSSSSDSDSSLSDSSDSDDGPEQLPSKLAPATAPEAASANGKGRPTKRPRSVSYSSSSGSSSISPASSSLPRSSDSDVAPPAPAASSFFKSTVAPVVPLASTSATALSIVGADGKPTVPPGEGLKRTKSRNARKRLLKASRDAEEAAKREAEKGYGSMEIDTQMDELVPLRHDRPVQLTRPLAAVASVAAPAPASPPPASPLKPVTETLAATPAAAPTPTPAPKRLPLDPYGELYGPQLDMLHLASGNKNKRKTIVGLGSNSKRTKQGKRTTFFDDPQRATEPDEGASGSAGRVWGAEASSSMSPRHEPDSPPMSASSALILDAPPPPAPATPASASKKGKKVASSTQAEHPQHLPPPSKRTDLPRNVLVTRVDVEAQDWEAGVGQRMKGTSKDWAGWTRSAPVAALGAEPPRAGTLVESAKKDADPEESTEDWGWSWRGWPSRARVDERWEDGELKKVERGAAEAKEGCRIATKVLELNPLTFAPELALKFGELLPSSSSASLRIKLYPSCSFVEEEEDADPAQWDGEEDYDGGYRRAARARFGMGVDGEEEGGVAEGEEEVWEGEWVDVRLVE